jgi:O-antigen ligase
MSDFDIGVGPTLAGRVHEQLGAVGLFAVLIAFTLTTMDGGDIAPRIISGILLLMAALFFAVSSSQRMKVGVPTQCLLFMTLWGILQTLFFPQKLVFNGWTGVLFWFTAAVISMVGVNSFRRAHVATQFRLGLIYFCSAVCVLDLLQQASGANRYFWLIPSRYHVVFGSFAYWNNFAQFVELALPITLWHAVARSKPSVLFSVLAALQVCAVVASGSRAGAALVLLELVAVVAIAYQRHRNRSIVYGAAIAIALCIIFISAAGFDTLSSKLEQKDQISVRANINRSSLAMIRQHPFTGWGLDTYVPVYRMFALYDDGSYVNRAHDDWLQWTAEGGIFFSGAMLILVIWSARPAIRSGWGIGLLAIFIHAAVDYPFARFGVCGWYFALVSMMTYQRVPIIFEYDKPARESEFKEATA